MSKEETMSACDEKKKNVLSASYRLATFDSWSMECVVTKRALASAGFYYLQYGDNVKCGYCSLEMGEWREGDDPMKEHERWSPRCPFVNAATDVDGNVELGRKRCEDDFGWHRPEFRPHSRAQRGKQSKKMG